MAGDNSKDFLMPCQVFCNVSMPPKLIAPLLHHLLPLFKVRRPVVCPAIRITHRMRKLVLDVLNPDVENFVEDRAGHVTEFWVYAVGNRTPITTGFMQSHRARKGKQNEKSRSFQAAFARCEVLLDEELVDEKGIEPSASALRTRRSPS